MNATAHFRSGPTKTVDLLKGTDKGSLDKPWIHITPVGEHPGTVEIPAGYDIPGYGITDADMEVEGVTVFDQQVLSGIIHAFDDEDPILIDYEHFSHDKDKSTEAAGWGIGIRNASGGSGLELQADWSEPGREKILKKVYRHVSPEFAGSVRYEGGVFKFYPRALTGAGLTNRPKLKALKPVSANRDKRTTTPPTQMEYKNELCKLLKLDPATATDEEIKSKLPGVANDVAVSQNRATQITDLKAENERLTNEAIDGDLERFSDVIDDPESARDLLSKNRDSAVKIFTGMQKRVGSGGGNGNQKPVYQKNRATAPKGDEEISKDEKEQVEAQAKYRAIEAEAHQIASSEKIPFGQAFERAKAKHGR